MPAECLFNAQEFLMNQNDAGVCWHGFMSLLGGKQNTFFSYV